MNRVEDQIRWYDNKSRSSQVKFKLLKGLEIFSAVAITLAGSTDMKGHITAYLGALVLAVEAIEHLNQYAAPLLHRSQKAYESPQNC